ncbi:GL25062 [Drosophila persimilis]|uniref:GL25062 n=1 Tax=Drosophila persimilis TaxID=7234 RepID=B4GQY3_DROPE|nr:GL25062 [Drosophila persimilis]
MDAFDECTHSLLDVVTHLATLLAAQESGPKRPTAASVAKKRSWIFEALLRNGTMPSSTKEAFLRKVYLEMSGDRKNEMLRHFQHILGSQDPFIADAVIPLQMESDGWKVSRFRLKLLQPGPLQLNKPTDGSEGYAALNDRKRTMLTSVDDLRRQGKPLQFQPRFDFLLSRFGVHRAAPKRQQLVAASVTCSAISESMARIREPKDQMMRLTYRLPLPVKSPLPGQMGREKLERNFIAEGKPEKHFLSDISMSNELLLLQNKDLVLYYIDQAELIDHLKKAAAGLQSETFECPAGGGDQLQIKRNTTVRTVLPEVLSDFVQPFLESGTAFRRLSARIKSRGPRLEGPLNRAMRDTIIDFLSTNRQFFLSLPAESFSQLLMSAQPAMRLLQHLERMFETEPSLNLHSGVSGTFILASIGSAIDTCSNTDFLQLLMYLLKCMCQTYFAQLQRWVYKGELDEAVNEIFIRRRAPLDRQIDECSKEFFDKGYQVHEEEVPDFLSGCETVILHCGKYNRLLKACNAQHPAFDVAYPDIVVCLSEQQLTTMRRNLNDKYNRIRQTFEKCSMKSIFEERMASKLRFKNRMVERTESFIAAWEEEQRELLLESNAKKRLLYDKINAEQELQQRNRVQQRRLEVVQELQHQRDRERYEDQLLEREKLALINKIQVLRQRDLAAEDASGWEMAESPDNKLNRNRRKMLSSALLQECQSEVHLEESSSTGTELRAFLPPDINMNLNRLEETTEQSDLQRNRQRMLQHDGFNAFNSMEDVHTERVKCQLRSDSPLARNRRRVMASEFDIPSICRKITIPLSSIAESGLHLPLELNKLHLEVPLDAATPMSTTSDVDIDGLSDHNPFKEEESETDATDYNGHALISNAGHEQDPEPLLPANPLAVEPAQASVERRVTSMTSRLPAISSVLVPESCNPFMARRCLQMSVMEPVSAHYALLRNEVLPIFKEQHIFKHFRMLRNYFFLLNGEFGTQLTGGIFGYIRAGMDPRSLCQKGVLDVILNNALGGCAASDDTLVAQNLTLDCTKIPDGLDFMSLEATGMLTLKCKVNWPLNLVISGETITKYGQIFEHLLKLRHVTFVLEGAFQHLQHLAKLHGAALRTAHQFRHLQAVRHKLSHFMTTLQTHLVANALQATWNGFKKDLCGCDSIEGLYRMHVAYLKRVAFLALLNRRSAKIKETIDGILVIVLRFCKVLQSQSFVIDGEVFVHPRYKRLAHEEAEFEKFLQYFIYLGNKLAASGYQEEIGDLIRVINFNNYYKLSEGATSTSKN